MQAPSGNYNGFIRVNQYKAMPADCPNTVPNATAVKPVSLAWTTVPLAPWVTISAATDLTPTTARLNGTVNPNSLATTYYFEYGLNTGYGSVTPTVSAGAGPSHVAVTAALTGLTQGTTYHCRLVATNSVGTSVTADLTFNTVAIPSYTLSISGLTYLGPDSDPASLHPHCPLWRWYSNHMNPYPQSKAFTLVLTGAASGVIKCEWFWSDYADDDLFQITVGGVRKMRNDTALATTPQACEITVVDTITPPPVPAHAGTILYLSTTDSPTPHAIGIYLV